MNVIVQRSSLKKKSTLILNSTENYNQVANKLRQQNESSGLGSMQINLPGSQNQNQNQIQAQQVQIAGRKVSILQIRPNLGLSNLGNTLGISLLNNSNPLPELAHFHFLSTSSSPATRRYHRSLARACELAMAGPGGRYKLARGASVSWRRTI